MTQKRTHQRKVDHQARATPQPDAPDPRKIAAATKRVVAASTLENIRVVRVLVETPRDWVEPVNTFQINCETNYQRAADRTRFRALVRVQVQSSGEPPPDPPVHFEILLEAVYLFTDPKKASRLGEDDLRFFCYVNPAHQVWSIARSLIWSLAHQSGYPVTLPMFLNKSTP